MQNVEFKARLRDPQRARAICASLGAAFSGTLRQTDTYFQVPAGRLKRREIPGEPPQWILYRRHDAAGLKISDYEFLADADARARLGPTIDRPWLVVRKERDLFLHESVRVHLDRVAALGDFIEFEAPVTPARSEAAAHEAVCALRTAFAPAMGDPVVVGYADLLSEAGRSKPDTLGPGENDHVRAHPGHRAPPGTPLGRREAGDQTRR